MHQPRVHVQSKQDLCALLMEPSIRRFERLNSDTSSKWKKTSLLCRASSVIWEVFLPPHKPWCSAHWPRAVAHLPAWIFPQSRELLPKPWVFQPSRSVLRTECPHGAVLWPCPAKDEVKEEHFTAQLQDRGCRMMILVLTLVSFF